MSNYRGQYVFHGRGFCGLFVVDDHGNAVPLNPDNLVQSVAFSADDPTIFS